MNKSSYLTLESALAGAVAGLAVWIYQDTRSQDSQDLVAKCAATYYSADILSRDVAFTKCMKHEFSNTFMDAQINNDTKRM